MISDTFRLLTLEFLGPEETIVLSLENYSNIYERALPFGLLIYLFIRVCMFVCINVCMYVCMYRILTEFKVFMYWKDPPRANRDAEPRSGEALRFVRAGLSST